ncbi:ornithine cyclodeaminase family protein [Sulfolobus sp. S-194]|uniref:ornithine cyclodeaminase family protein n=1 Tax=Sulfolobus sp. S-194 TaxID=2512240 RepID=UPI001436EFF1|nr:ornithine cyclodeaminase family protein [Sulfolobus sp. S-194]QIW24969.1 ornithine cyclodeaminase family protein [Sulfolobus sp. S-194]
MIILTGKDLEEVLKPEIAVNAVRDAFSLFSSGKVIQPQRQVITIKGNWWGIMPSFTDFSFSTKIVNVIPKNKEKGLPSVQGVAILMSPDTGETLAVLEGSVLTAIRTASASVLSTELALGSRHIDTLGIIGAGMEAKYHLKIALKYFSVSRVLISARKSHYELAKEYNGEAVELERLLKESQVIYATTSSDKPVVLGKFLSNDFHVSSIGAHTPTAREIDDEAIMKSKTYFVDSLEAVSNESGDFIEPKRKGIMPQIYEIGEIINKNIKIQRPSIFKTVGIAAQDNITAYIAYEEALKRGIGIKI